MIRWATLFPGVPNPRILFDPDVPVRLVEREPSWADQHRALYSPFRFAHGMRFRRLATHPADARAGWHIDGSSLKLSVDAIGPVDGEFRFDAFHWILGHRPLGWERYEFLECVEFTPVAVLRAPEPRPMLHGLWVEVSDERCDAPLFNGWPPVRPHGPRLMPVGSSA